MAASVPAAVLAPLPLAAGDTTGERFLRGAGVGAFLGANLLAAVVLVPIYLPSWLVIGPAATMF